MKSLTVAVLSTLLAMFSSQAQQPSPGSRVEGRVLDNATGKPLSGVLVMATDFASGAAPVTTTTSTDGRFLFENISFTRVDIGAGKPGYPFNSTLLTLSRGTNITDVVLRLSSTGIVAGRVLDPSGRPAVLAQVQIVNFKTADRSRPYPDVLQTNDRGEFRADIEPGSYLLAYFSGRNTRNGFERPNPATVGPILYPGVSDTTLAVPVEVKSGEETRIRDVVLTPVRMGAIRLHIINDTGQAPSPTIDFGIVQGIRFQAFNGPFINVEGGWDREITREYWAPLPGTYSITAGWRLPDANGTVVRTSKIVEFTGADIEVEFRIAKDEGRLRGRIMVESENGGALRPYTNLRLRLRPEAGPEDDDLSVAPDGTFSASGLPLGRYDVRMQNLPDDLYVASARQGNRDALTDGVLVQKEESSVEIIVSPGAVQLEGKVTTAAGRPAHNARVLLVPAKGMSDQSYRNDRTDQNGAFRLLHVTPGAYHLYAFPADKFPGSIDPDALKQFEARGTPITIQKGSRPTVALSLIE